METYRMLCQKKKKPESILKLIEKQCVHILCINILLTITARSRVNNKSQFIPSHLEEKKYIFLLSSH